MIKLWKALVLAGLFGLNACGAEEEVLETPEVPIVVVSNDPVTVILDDLADDPAIFENEYLEITGQYSQMPLLICDTDPHPSPGQWGITDGSLLALAGGFDSQLRALQLEGRVITVAGRWRQWEGPVGCGKKAVQQSIWYLDVDRIISPSPLSDFTSTPVNIASLNGGAQETPADVQSTPLGTATPVAQTGPTADPALATPIPASSGTPSPLVTPSFTPFSLATPSPTVATATASAGNTATATSMSSLTGTPTAVATASPTAAAGSSPIATSPPGSTVTPLPTVTPVTPLPTQPVLPTATPATGGYFVTDQGPIDAEELIAGRLGNNEIHSWTHSLSSSDTITVAVAASPSSDVILSILDGSGNTVTEQNVAPAGDIEQISGLSLPSADDYKLQIRTANGNSASYAVMLLLSDSYDFVFQGILNNGDTSAGSLAADSDHFWFFQGGSGDSITITVIPDVSGDLFIELYGVNGQNISGFIDDGIGGEQEQLLDFMLPDAGMYSIRVGEYDFLPSGYQIELLGP
jgi:hypothetical protein